MMHAQMWCNCCVIVDMRTTSALSNPDQTEPDDITWNPLASAQHHKASSQKIDLTQVFQAHQLFSQSDVIKETPLTQAPQLSAKYGASILLKREDNQRGRTFKIRGAYYQYLMSNPQRRKKGYVLCSDGNFASSYAIIAGMFQTPCVCFVPRTCHQHKLQNIRRDGKEWVDLHQVGDDYEACQAEAVKYSEQNDMPLLVPFDTLTLLHGYATIAKEIAEACIKRGVDYVLIPAGGGGLISALASTLKQISPNTKVIGVEPDTCRPYSSSVLSQSLVTAEKASKFCNGSSVKGCSAVAMGIGRQSIDGFVEVSERKLAETVIKLYSQGFICQPSGALSVAGLQKVRQLVKGKMVVCLLSGANMDLVKLEQAREMAMVSKGKKNHLQLTLPNRHNVIYELITNCFKSTDIISIHYSKRFGKEESQAMLSIESATQEDVESYLEKLSEHNYHFQNINEREDMLDIFF